MIWSDTFTTPSPRDLGIVLQLFPGTAMYSLLDNHKLYGSPLLLIWSNEIGDTVKFVDGNIVGFIVGTTNAPDVILVWLCSPNAHSPPESIVWR